MHGSWLLCSVGVVGLLASTAHSQSGRSEVIAIDVLIEPDAAMVDRARAVNEALRRDYPAGYALDASHAPHITLLQRFIRRGDLDAVSKAVAAESDSVGSLSMSAIGCQLVEWGGIGLAVIVVESSPELRALEARIIAAVQPFAVKGGGADAFAVAQGDEPINKETIAWVENYVPGASGQNFAPHVTVGAAPVAVIKALLETPFDSFAFGAKGIAIYQLGNFGTAQVRLWAIER